MNSLYGIKVGQFKPMKPFEQLETSGPIDQTIYLSNWAPYEEERKGPQIRPPVPQVVSVGTFNGGTNDPFTFYHINSREPYAFEYMVTKYGGGPVKKLGTNLGR